MSCHGPDADLVSAADAGGLLCRVALEAMHTRHLTFGLFDGGCGIPSMLSDRARLIETCLRRWWLFRRSARSCLKVADVQARVVAVG